MSLANVWLDTLGDGLIRADAIIGVRAHCRETLPLAGRRRAGGLHRQRPDRQLDARAAAPHPDPNRLRYTPCPATEAGRHYDAPYL
jgi:hypothetical protein